MASVLRFGPFELDRSKFELSRNGQPVKLDPTPLELLFFLAERAGTLVTRDEAVDHIWGKEVFVEPDSSLYTAVRKIRKALDDDTGEPRFIQTISRKGYRFIATVTWDSEPPLTSDTGSEDARERQNLPSGPARRKHPLWIITAIGALLAAGLVVTSFLVRQRSGLRPGPVLQRTLTRVTFDPGLQFGATFSPDGQFIAFSSDRGGKFDIWVQQIGATDPRKITTLPGHNWQPDWSPDGSQIAFRSEGDRGGLFVVPAFGGPERKISSFGYRPRWSPDGTQILFESAFVAGIWSKLYVATPDGRPPCEILSDFLAQTHIGARSAAWYPASSRISVWGKLQNGRGFWTVDPSGEHAVKSDIAPSLDRQLDQIEDAAPQFRWSPRAGSLYFEAESKDVRNVWKVRVDRKSLGWTSLERLTMGPGPDSDLALSEDGRKLAFTDRTERVRIWSWPLDRKSGSISGEGRPVTPGGLDAWMPDISRDGKKLLFVTRRFEKWELWEVSTVDRRETLLRNGRHICSEPRWSPDGMRIVCSESDPEHSVLVPEGGGPEEVLVSKGFEASARDWSPDGQFLVSVSGPSEHGILGGRDITSMLLLPISAAPRAETQARLITSTHSNGFYQMRFSPDGRWIAFELVGIGAGDAQLYVVPVAGGPWIPITDGKSWDDKPRWSADGKMLYFMSSRTGLLNVWAVRFDSAAGHTAGEPFQVTVFGDPSLMMPAQDPYLLQISVAEDRLVLPLASVSGNIWLLENVDQ